MYTKVFYGSFVDGFCALEEKIFVKMNTSINVTWSQLIDSGG